MDNYDSVMSQLAGFGLQVGLQLQIGKLTRCQFEGDRPRQKTGWYSLHEVTRTDGSAILVGAYGTWREGGTHHSVKVTGAPMSAEQKLALRERIKLDRQVAEAARSKDAERAAIAAQRAWKALLLDGESEYLRRKKVGAHGVRFSARGNLAIPITDAAGRLHGLQIIYGDQAAKEKRGRDKDFWPAGLAKRGHFHLVGVPAGVLLVAEGYATAASLHEATGHAVAVAFDAGNLLPVAQALRKRYPGTNLLICGDDDFKTAGNPGATSAQAAATAVKGHFVLPVFSDRGDNKLTDFNDLAVIEGGFVVRAQVASKLRDLGWSTDVVGAPAGRITQGGGGGGAVNEFHFDLQGLLAEFTLVYGTDTVFDDRRKLILGLGPLRSAAGKALVRDWLENPGRQTVLPAQVVFDPTQQSDPATTRNLFAGWPTVPRKGDCTYLLELLAFLCSDEKGVNLEVYYWVQKWLAFPIQNPGAKMQTALMIHGPEGTGKNTFFGCIEQIYGEYGCQFGQFELESQFNGWASRKLFAVGNEVVNRAEKYHVQGRLKSMITEPKWQINEKQLPSREESNCCNFCFFSNRNDIAKLDTGDRRYLVLRTLQKLEAEFYEKVRAEIRNGGVAALHYHLSTLDLQGFHAHTLPPETKAKAQLIDLGLDSTERFWRAWVAEDVTTDSGALPVIPCLYDDLYQSYRAWCNRSGISRPAPAHVLKSDMETRGPTIKGRAKWEDDRGNKHQNPVVIPDPGAKPPGLTEAAWLSPNIEAFREALKHYRAGGRVGFGDE